MKIFVLNNGSSSMKCSLFDFQKNPDSYIAPVWQAHAQWGSMVSAPFIQVKDERGNEYTKEIQSSSVGETLREVLGTLSQDEQSSIDVIGHRIVHGGSSYKKSMLIMEEVIKTIGQLAELAPLHNEADVEGIRAFEQLLPNVPQVAVFDTAFHHTLPLTSKVYPVPYSWYEEGIQRYGFHGTSYHYCTRRVFQLMSPPPAKMVVCHLGSGASLCAIRDGLSVDTTMGFTPLEGLMMDTRSGSIDPGILLYRMRQKKSSPDELYQQLYRESGLLGVSGRTSDMRDIIEMSPDHEREQLAFDMYLHRLISCIGSMIASLRGLDALVFTAGIGENSPIVRERVCEAFSFLGIKLDMVMNNLPHKEDCDLSAKGSTIKVLLIHTQEAFEIARECWFVTQKISIGDRSQA